MVFVLCVVLKNSLLLHRKSKLPEGVCISGIALQSLKIIIFKDSGNGAVAFFIQVLYQLAATSIIIIQHGYTVGEFRVNVVHKNHRDASADQFAVEAQIGVGKASFGSLYQ